MSAGLLKLNIDWVAAYEWECPFCGGDLDHFDDEVNETAGWVDANYTCKQRGSDFCKSNLYFVWRYPVGANEDTPYIGSWIDIEIDDKYINSRSLNPDDRLGLLKHATKEKTPTKWQLKKHIERGELLLKRLATMKKETNECLTTLRVKLEELELEQQNESEGE